MVEIKSTYRTSIKLVITALACYGLFTTTTVSLGSENPNGNKEGFCESISVSQSKDSNEWKTEFIVHPIPRTVYLNEGSSKRMLTHMDGFFSLQGLKIPKSTVLSLTLEYEWGSYDSKKFENLRNPTIELLCLPTSRPK